MTDPARRFAEALVALHQLVEGEENLSDTLTRMTTAASRAIDEVVSAGLTLRAGKSGTTVAFAGEEAPRLDSAQYADGVGPCLEAMTDGRVLNVPDISGYAERWPSFTRTAADLGIRSSLSLPLATHEASFGALNLYATRHSAFDEDALRLAEDFAAQASIAVGNAQVYWRARDLASHLSAALQTRDVLGQAKGILMRDRRVDSDAAFDLLRECSQRRNVKVRDIADYVVRTGELPDDDTPLEVLT